MSLKPVLRQIKIWLDMYKNIKNVGLGTCPVHHSKLGRIFKQKFLPENFCGGRTKEREVRKKEKIQKRKRKGWNVEKEAQATPSALNWNYSLNRRVYSDSDITATK